MSRNWRFVTTFAIALAIAPFITACGETPVEPTVVHCPDGSVAPDNDASRCPVTPPVEKVSVSSVNISTSFVGVSYPMVQVTISASGLSTAGKPVTVAIMVDGSPVNGSIVLPEGSHTFCATATSSSGVKSDETCQTRAITWPGFNIQYVAATPTGEYVPQGLWAVVEDVDSVQIGSSGKAFIPSLLAQTKDTVKIVTRGSNEVFPTLARVERKYYGNFVQVSSVRNWTIPTGTYAGQTIVLSMEEAYKETPPQPHGFFPRWQKLGENGYRYTVGSYTSYPVKVAIFRNRSSIEFSAENESKLWARWSETEQALGFDFYIQSDTTSVNALGGIRYTSNPGASGGPDNPTRGDYISGMVNIGTGSDNTFSALEPTSGTAKHELLHASGPIGHTCQWTSLMEQNCLRNSAETPMPKDVAYWHLMRLTRGLERKYGTRFSVAQMHQGERVFLLGLPEDGVIVFGPEGFSW